MTENINQSFCALEVKKSDYYRYLCCLFIPESLRWRAFAIYAFNSEIAKIKDVVSEPMMGHIRLQWWRDAIDEIYSGNSPKKHKHNISEELYKVISEVKVPKHFFETLIDAREADIDFTGYETIENIEEYLSSTSSTLLKMLIVSMGFALDENIEKMANNVGIAYALTGILRALKHDAHHRRIMLPKNLLDKNGINSDEIIEGKKLEKVIPIIEEMCGRVELNLAEAKSLMPKIPKQISFIFLPLAIVYPFLKRIKKTNYDIFGNDIEIGKLTMQLTIFKAAVFARV